MTIELSGIASEAIADVAAESIVVHEYEKTGANPQAANPPHLVCANCSAFLQDQARYCHTCGQSSHIHHSLLHMVEEVLHGLFHFDTKAWRTLPALVVNPGQLTRQYLDGKRTAFVSPLALFLFMVFIMFFVLSFTLQEEKINSSKAALDKQQSISNVLATTQKSLSVELKKEAEIKNNDAAIFEKREEIHELRRLIKTLEEQLENLNGTPKTDAAIQNEIAQRKLELSQLHASQASIAKSSDATTNDAHIFKMKALNQQIAFTESDLASAQKKALKQIQAQPPKDEKAKGSNTKSTSTDEDKNTDLSTIPYIGAALKHAKYEKELTLYKMKSKAASFAFVLMPISLPFLWLLFAFKRKYVMFDHAVFSLYSLSFMCILIMLISVLAKFNFSTTAGWLFVLIPPIHMYRQLRGAYQLSVSSTVWRTIALLLIAFFSLTLYAALIIGLSTYAGR